MVENDEENCITVIESDIAGFILYKRISVYPFNGFKMLMNLILIAVQICIILHIHIVMNAILKKYIFLKSLFTHSKDNATFMNIGIGIIIGITALIIIQSAIKIITMVYGMNSIGLRNKRTVVNKAYYGFVKLKDLNLELSNNGNNMAFTININEHQAVIQASNKKVYNHLKKHIK